MASAKSRNYFSIPFIIGAAQCARGAKAVEDGYDGQDGAYLQAHALTHRAYAVGAVISATCCLEAFINECFSDADQVNLPTLRGLTPAVRETLAGLWELGIPRTAKYTILEKYEIAYFVVKQAKMARGVIRFQNADLLTELRNALVHFEPEWVDHVPPDLKRAHQFEKRFKAKKLPENRLTSPQNPFYPDRLVGYGCAQWAVETAVGFIDWFGAEIGVVPFYEPVRRQLQC